jgi:hypothetical protein
VAAIPLLAARPATAQLGCSGATCTVEITMPVTDVLRLTLSTGGIPLGTPDETDFTNGYKDFIGAAVTATVKANRPFHVQVSGGSPLFGYAGSLPNPSKPASDLRWATSQAGLAGASNDMGTPGLLMNLGASASAQASLYLRTLWNFTRDVPGTYSMSIRFTLSAP